MAIDFSKFDKAVNTEVLNNQMANANTQDDNTPVPAGKYTCTIENMEITETADKEGLRFSAWLKIKETLDAPTKQDGRFTFYGKKICGNQVTEKWNDGVAIKLVTKFIAELTGGDEIEFKSYEQFDKDIQSAFNDLIKDKIEVDIELSYNAKGYPNHKIIEVYDV